MSFLLESRLVRGALVGALILLFAFLLFRNIGVKPSGIEGDEFAVVLGSYLHDHGIPPVEKGIWSVHQDTFDQYPFTRWIPQVGFRLFGDDLLSPRKFLILLKAGSLLFLFLSLRNLTSFSTAICILLLYAFGTLHLLSSVVVIEGSLCEPWIALSLYLLTRVRMVRHGPLRILTLVGAGAAVTATLFTYNIVYGFSFCAVLTVFVEVFRQGNGSFKKKIAWLFCFLIPIAAFSPLWLRPFRSQASSRSYALEYSALKEGLSVEQRLKAVTFNARFAGGQLLRPLLYEGSDMLATYPARLVPPLFSLLGLAGLVFLFARGKRWWPYGTLFVVNAGLYQVLMGLWLPRMWLITIFGLAILASFGTERLLEFARRHSRRAAIVANTILLLASAGTAYSQWRLFSDHGALAPRLTGPSREMVEVAETYRLSAPGSVLFSIADPAFRNQFLTARAFVDLAKGKVDPAVVRTETLESLSIYSEEGLLSSDELSDRRVRRVVVFMDSSSLANPLVAAGFKPVPSPWRFFTEFTRDAGGS
ncbi:MAG: glycosyltransferase family 39 protein [Pseudomonadota bacterium]